MLFMIGIALLTISIALFMICIALFMVAIALFMMGIALFITTLLYNQASFPYMLIGFVKNKFILHHAPTSPIKFF